MEMRRLLLKVSPYLAAILAGLLFTFVGLSLEQDIKAIFISISAAFYAIPLIFLFYRAAQNLSERRLNKEIFDYAKMQIDREVLSITLQLSKMVYRLEERNHSPKGISTFLSLQKDELKQVISQNEYLGFQLLKKWDVAENSLNGILCNALIVQRLENNQIIAAISIIKSLRHLESMQRVEGLFAPTGSEATSYRLVCGREMSERNVEFPDRYLLLQDVGNDRWLVADFGDFAPYDANDLLNILAVDARYLEAYTSVILELMADINNWLGSTGGEFVVDTKMFRMGHQPAHQPNPPCGSP